MEHETADTTEPQRSTGVAGARRPLLIAIAITAIAADAQALYGLYSPGTTPLFEGAHTTASDLFNIGAFVARALYCVSVIGLSRSMQQTWWMTVLYAVSAWLPYLFWLGFLFLWLSANSQLHREEAPRGV